MKLVLARQRIGESFGGAEGYVAMLAGSLRDMGSTVTLMAQAVDAGVDRSAFEFLRVPSRPANIWSVLYFAGAVAQYVREHPDRPLISFDRIPGVACIRAGDGSHQVYLESMGQSVSAKFSIKHRIQLSLERKTYTHPNLRLVFANSKMVAEDIRRQYDVSADKLRVVYTGLPARANIAGTMRTSARLRLRLPERTRVMLFAGHNYERKGLATLLAALLLLEKQDGHRGKIGPWALLVAGRGDIPKYRRMANRMQIGGMVEFLGPASLDDIFPAADLFVLPTRYDPLARVCMESARAGVPVVTTRKNGFAEWIDPETGFVMDRPQDAGELAEILSRALSSDLSAAGDRQRLRTQHLTIEGNAEEILTHLGRGNWR